MNRFTRQLLETLPLGLSLLVMLAFALVGAAPLSANPPKINLATLTPTPTSDALLKPIVLLTVYNPWLMVIGSDEPTFALYENGLVIYQRKSASGDYEFASELLTPDEFTALKARLHIDQALYALDANHDYYAKTDQSTNVIRLSDPILGDKTISIYGDLYADPEARQLAAPKRLVDLFDLLTGYSHPKAQTWLPEKFEVMLWSYDTRDAVDWPDDWPGLDDPTTVQRDALYSIYIDIHDYTRYLALRRSANALRVDGRTWAFAARFPLPHEIVWHTPPRK